MRVPPSSGRCWIFFVLALDEQAGTTALFRNDDIYAVIIAMLRFFRLIAIHIFIQFRYNFLKRITTDVVNVFDVPAVCVL